MTTKIKASDVGAVVPPKIVRGKRGTQVPADVLKVFADTMVTVDEDNHPSWVSDNVAYDTRPKANAAAMKIRKALADPANKDYKWKNVSEIQSRVWSTGALNDKDEETAPFFFALAERAAE